MRKLALLSLLLAFASLIAAVVWYAQLADQLPLDGAGLPALTASLAAALGASLIAWGARFLRDSLQAGRYRWQQWLRNKLQVESGQRLHEADWLVWTLDASLLLTLPLLVMHFWGLTEVALDLLQTLSSKGFKLGNSSIVPAQILLGVVLFAALLTFTRWLRQRLERRWLLRTQMDLGTRTAVATIFGYATFVLALLLGLSIAGVELTNLAVVAGALSVGIGFGLQNIVNNFVSGLILLFERPIRVGDYVSVGDVTGYVRRISIRSTEIETGDRVSVIVPNSNLIANPVKNWMLRDRYGRISIAVGVVHGSDLELVKKLLLDCAAAHKDTIKPGHPFILGPAVLFTSFGEAGLNFQLAVSIQDVDQRGGVISDLNFAIERSFREHGVQMPVAQRVWLQSSEQTSSESA